MVVLNTILVVLTIGVLCIGAIVGTIYLVVCLLRHALGVVPKFVKWFTEPLRKNCKDK